MLIPAALLTISLLVIIHEFGHYIVARAFGMRVLTFSIGFGPSLLRWRPKGSETVFQIALIPVLAYVQIAGMNPREETDPNDRGSYQNAKPLARFLTIAAGPLANFLAAGLALFIVSAFGGEPVGPTDARIGQVAPNSAARTAGIRDGDLVREVNGRPVRSWDELVRTIANSQRRPLDVAYDAQGMIHQVNGAQVRGWNETLAALDRETQPRSIAMRVERRGQMLDLTVVPRMNFELSRPMVGIGAVSTYRPVSLGQSIEFGIVQPAAATHAILKKLGEIFQHHDDVQLMGPVGIVTATVEQAEKGWRQGAEWIAMISLQLFIFNLLPIPALDGGRLLVLGYEMATKRKPNPKIEARVLAYSLVLMLGLFLVVTSRELWTLISGWITRARG